MVCAVFSHHIARAHGKEGTTTKLRPYQQECIDAIEAQLRSIRRMLPGYDTGELTKGDASMILNRMFNGGKRYDRSTRAKSRL